MGYRITKIIFEDDGKRVNYINIIISGWFYCSLHYYIKSIDAYCEKKFNLVQPYIENRRALKIIEEERLNNRPITQRDYKTKIN